MLALEVPRMGVAELYGRVAREQAHGGLTCPRELVLRSGAAAGRASEVSFVSGEARLAPGAG
jgi:hypothetical protein